MSKTAFMFPGQGSQCVGMGADFYEACPKARAVYDMASELIGIDMKKLCFEENELLDRTDYTQAALVTTCMAMTKEIMARGLTQEMKEKKRASALASTTRLCPPAVWKWRMR